MIAFVLLNFIPALGAFYLARFLNRGGRAELFLLMILIYFFEALVAFGLPGLFGQLNYVVCGVANAVIGGALCFFKRFEKKLPPAVPLLAGEKLLAASAVAILLLRFYWASFMHSGTDAFLYHLYYPAMWLTEGKIYPVSLAGLPHEYFPVYGEILYGWFMLPFGDESFAFFLQLTSIVMAGLAILAVTETFGFRRIDGLAAVNLMIFTSIIGENSLLGYTDVLNGAFLLAGASLLLIGALRNDNKAAIVAGCTLGCSAAIKYSGLMLTPLLTAGLLIFLVLHRKKLWKFALILAASACVAAVPSYLANWIRTGNPFYPVKIMPAGIPLFPNGIEFERPTSGLRLDTWKMFVNSNVWDMNTASGIFYLALPVLAILLFIFCRPKLKKQFIFPFLAVMLILLGIVQLSFYPSMAQARQIIPLLMCFPLLVLPVANTFLRGRSGINMLAGAAGVLLLCFLLSHISHLAKMIFMWAVVCAFLLLLCFWRDRYFRYGILLACAILIFCLPLCFQIRIGSKLANARRFGGPGGGMSVEIVWNRHVETKKAINIASVGSWYNFLYLADMSGNKVVYIPVNEKNSTHPHDFATYQEIRDNPVPYSVWLSRLREANIDYLVVDYSAHFDFMTNLEQEVRWAEAHPETFEKLFDTGKILFFRLKPKQ